MIDFDKVFNEVLQSERKVYPVENNQFFPSNLTFPCRRNIVYRYLYPEMPESDETMRVFKIGSLLNDEIQRIFGVENEEFKVVDVETQVRSFYMVDGDRIRIRGRADVLIEKDGVRYIVELKSMKPSYYFDWKIRKVIRNDPFHYLNEPKLEHLLQNQWYMHILGIERGYILYFEKVGLQCKVFPVSLADFNVEESIIPIAKFIYRCLRDGVIPKREPNHWNGLICDYCKFREICL